MFGMKELCVGEDGDQRTNKEFVTVGMKMKNDNGKKITDVNKEKELFTSSTT
jgi:hypothetical protein